MTRVGSFLSRVSVTQPYTTQASVQGGSMFNPAAFILTNQGRNGPDRVTINSIEVIDQSYANTAATGTFRLARILLNGTQPNRLDKLPIVPSDSAFPVPAGLEAYPGLVPFTTTEGINNPLFTPSYMVAANTFSMMGIGGDMTPPPVILQDGQGLNIDALGSSHSTLNVTVLLEAGGHQYSVCGDTVGRGDVFTVVNRTGSPVVIRGARVSDYPRITATTITYLAAVVSGRVELDWAAKTVALGDLLPPWVRAGQGAFPLSLDNWSDPPQMFGSFTIYRHNTTTASTVMPPTQRLMKVTKNIILDGGQSLVLYPSMPQQSAGNAGEHDIEVMYTVEALGSKVGGSGEYSYAY
jgi:hypothetical protein